MCRFKRGFWSMVWRTTDSARQGHQSARRVSASAAKRELVHFCAHFVLLLMATPLSMSLPRGGCRAVIDFPHSLTPLKRIQAKVRAYFWSAAASTSNNLSCSVILWRKLTTAFQRTLLDELDHLKSAAAAFIKIHTNLYLRQN